MILYLESTRIVFTVQRIDDKPHWLRQGKDVVSIYQGHPLPTKQRGGLWF